MLAILQQWNLSLASNTQGPSSTPAAQVPPAISKLAHVPTSGDASQPSVLEVKSSARKELPAVFFLYSLLFDFGIFFMYALPIFQ